MKVFDKFPKEQTCPICGTNMQGKCVLIGINGTQEGRNVKAQCFHLDCIELLYDKRLSFLFQKFEVKK